MIFMVIEADMDHRTLERIKYPEDTCMRVFVNQLQYRSAHFHTSFEIGLVMEGSIECSILGEKYILDKNDIMILNPNQLHEYTAISNSVTVLFIQFTHCFIEGISQMLKDLFFDTYVLKYTENKTRNEELICLIHFSML